MFEIVKLMTVDEAKEVYKGCSASFSLTTPRYVYMFKVAMFICLKQLQAAKEKGLYLGL